MTSDGELLSAWADGNQDAAEQLIDRHFSALHRFFETTAPTHADDLVQDTFVACLESRQRYRAASTFRTFLFGIARNKLLMFWRTRARRGIDVDVLEMSLEDLGASPTQVVARAEQERQLLQGLRRIPLQAQILLELFYWEGLRGPQLAEALQVPEGTIRTRLRRARSLLETAIVDSGAPSGVVRSTIDDLERWAASVRDKIE